MVASLCSGFALLEQGTPQCEALGFPVPKVARTAYAEHARATHAQQILKCPLDNSMQRCILKHMLNQMTPDQVFHALGDSTRRRLVERLSRGPASVSDLAKPLGITLAAVVQHLQVLERCGVVRTQKVGRVRTCRIEPAGLNVAAEWIAERQSLWERRLDRLGEILTEEDQTTGQPTRKRDRT